MMPSAKILPVFALILAFAGCASAPRYEALEANLNAGRYEAAAQSLKGDEKRYGANARLLYYFDCLWAEHLAGHYAQSNEFVEKANALIDELYTKSVSKEALAFLGNDMSLPYQGENFERVMLHIVGMLNYARLGDVDAALVESRRADERMKQYVAKFGKDKIVYQQDALARYLSAALYELEGGQQLSDAYLDYKKTDEAFGLYGKAYGTPYPKLLEKDLLRMADGLGESEEYSKFSKRFSGEASTPLKSLKRDKGEVIVLLYEGLAPVKISENVSLPMALRDGTRQYFSMAFPHFVARQQAYSDAWLQDDQGQTTQFELFQDITNIAIRDLKDRVGLITVKAIARATVKFQAARAIQAEAKKAGGAAELFAFLGTNIYGVVSEQADTRSWRTLPSRILLARLAMEPGKHHLKLSVGKGDHSSDILLENVDVQAGKKVFLTQRID
jgi:hypothetical protein